MLASGNYFLDGGSKSPDAHGQAAYVKIMILPNHRTTRLIRLREPPLGAEAEARPRPIGLKSEKVYHFQVISGKTQFSTLVRWVQWGGAPRLRPAQPRFLTISTPKRPFSTSNYERQTLRTMPEMCEYRQKSFASRIHSEIVFKYSTAD